MSLFRNLMERSLESTSRGSAKGTPHQGKQARNRRPRFLNLEALEHRSLLSVSPGMPPEAEAADFTPTAIVAAIDPGETTHNAWLPSAEVEQPLSQDGDTTANSPPIAVDDAFTLTVNQQLGSRVLANDFDPDGDTLSVALETGVSHGRLTLGEAGLFTYRPDKGFSGVDRFTYTISDGQSQSTPATVTIEVAAITNQIPIASGDAYTIDQGTTLMVDMATGLLANDSDVDGDALTVRLVDPPSHGTVTLADDGSFEYTPEADYHGADSFTYVASDGVAESAAATVAITIEAVNDAPLAADDAYTIGEDGTLIVATAAGLLANDSDVDGDALTVRLVDPPSHGTVTLADDGSFQYTPEADYHGADSFTYVASDGVAESAAATVAITIEAVNDAPLAADDAYTIGEDGTLIVDTAAGLLANDSDIDGDALTVRLVDPPSHGTVTVADDGSFEYTPEADYHGADSFTYVASDGVAESTAATVAITIDAVNDAPLAADDAYTIGEDGTLIVDTAAGLLANDSDVDGDTLTVRLVDPPSHGTVTLADGGSFQYTPEADYHGADSFTYVASDGVAESTAATVAITIDAVNDAPLAADDAYTIGEDGTLIVDTAAGLLANDSDIDGDALTVRLVDPPSHGTVTLADDGSFQYTPEADYHGADSFTYVASDGVAESAAATVAITIEAVNDAPLAADDAYTIGEDGTLIVDTAAGLLANDSDVDGDALTVRLVDPPSHGTVTLADDGSFEYTPEADYHGADSFTYVASDGVAESAAATVAITIEAVNDAPVAADDAYAIGEDGTLIIDTAAGLLANDSDVDGDALTVRLVDPPSHGTVTLADDGSFQYTPEADYYGADSFTYVASDGVAESAVATVAITIEAVNDVPVAADDAYAIGEDGTLIVDTAAGLLANDSDVDGDALTVRLVDPPSHGTVTLADDGSFEYTPEADYHGADSFTYVASDGVAESAAATVAITIEAVNDAPLAADDAYTIGEDGTLVVDAAAGLLANDSDVDGDALTVRLVDPPSHGTVTVADDGSFEYTPEADYHGADSFTYVAGDGVAESTAATVAITIEAVNDAPVAADDAYTIGEDGTLIVDTAAGLLANDSDVDGDALTVRLVDPPSHGTVTLADDGSFQYTPEADYHGADSFTYVASDGVAESAAATVAITIEAVNDAPVAADDAYAIGEDGTLIVDTAAGLLANDSDVDGDTLTVRLVDPPSHGTVTLADDGSFEYTPEADYHGADSFTYVAGDGAAESAAATVSVEVMRSQLAVDLRITGTPFGAEVGGTWAGNTFWVSAYVTDLREFPAGVIGGAIDLAYDGLSVVPTGEVAYGEAFSLFQQGDVNPDAAIIDELGALTGVPMVGVGQAAPFVSWQFTRVGTPASFVNTRVEFSTDPGEGTATIDPGNFALAGSDAPVDWLEVKLGSAGVDLAFADFNFDQRVDHFDLALWTPHRGSAAEGLRHDAFFDLNGDNRIDEADLDLLAQAMYGGGPPESLA